MDLGALVRRLVAGPTGAGGAAPSGDSGRAPGPDAPTGGSAGTSPSGNALARPAWRDLPPLQRVVGAAPLVAPNAVFEARLASSRPAPIALAPLGHDRGLEAPAGLVSGIAAPVQRAPSSPMPASVRPSHGDRRRETAGQGAAGRAWSASPFDAAAPAMPDAPEATGSPAGDPARPLAPELVSPASPSPALLIAPGPVPDLVGFVGHAAVSSAAQGAPVPTTGLLAAAAVMPSAATRTASAPLLARAAASDARPGAAPLAAPEGPTSPAAFPPSADRPVRRIRLGAPLTPTVARMAIPGTASSATSLPGATPAPGSTTEDRLPSPAAQGTSDGARAAADPEAVARAGGAASSTPLPAPLALVAVHRSATAAPTMRPLVGGLRPMLASGPTAVAVFRAAAPEAATEAAPAAPGPSAAMAALARIDPGAADWAPAVLAGVATGSSTGSPSFSIEPAVPGGVSPARLSWSNPMADASGQPTPTTVTPTSMHPLAAAPVASASRAVARTGGLRVGQAQGSPGVRASAASVARQMGAPSGAWPASSSALGSSSSSLTSSSASLAPTVARAVAIDEIDVRPAAQEAEAGAGAGETGAEGGGATGGEQGAPGAPAGGAANPLSAAVSEAVRDQETQAWADRLYDRIAMRLSRDLLVERERAGALVDRGF